MNIEEAMGTSYADCAIIIRRLKRGHVYRKESTNKAV